ncbi:hypothetical protein APTSU1_000085900 [Apodemus speciosus]|uniref:Uncharacterized protein n=1 Tax=Apodemus speciosus TaxID=105296 RepID=A0ABQ0EES0_APOSI
MESSLTPHTTQPLKRPGLLLSHADVKFPVRLDYNSTASAAVLCSK